MSDWRDWRDWGRRGLSFANAEGQRVDTLAVQAKRRFFVRYAGARCARCARCHQYLRITELAEFLPSRDEKQMRHVSCPDGSANKT